jgi:hypothetical protein
VVKVAVLRDAPDGVADVIDRDEAWGDEAAQGTYRRSRYEAWARNQAYGAQFLVQIRGYRAKSSMRRVQTSD